MLQSLILAASFLVSTMTFAQQPPGPRPTNPEYQAESRLVTLRFVPMAKKGKLYLAGHKAADLDFHRDAKLLDVTLFQRGQKKDTLQVNRVGDSFQEYEVTGLPTPPEPYDLQIRAEVRGKIEQMQLKVNPSKP